MGILTAEMRRAVAEVKLGFYATVCPDGTPNVSPKGTTWHGEGLKPSVPIPADPDVPFEKRADRQLERAREWLEADAAGAKAA